ncbi:MAG TPA: flagellar hook capping FlgD N-terminal domain-containing protein [Opitutaceae bacterium]|jgi:flagellar basal-body rod modification protein FlgD|nr:flagellar hook capping FlgD N-terminal domain-containing protein [Opitutaceae bacterium]
MTVTPTTSTTTHATTPTVPATSSTTGSSTQQALGINDFMKLLATQFQEQDPLKPMDDTAFIAQTAQFTALQQATTLTQQVSQMAASSYIGRQVSVNDGSGKIVSGTVSAVDTSGSAPQLLINGVEYPISNLEAISPPSTTTTTPATTPSS